MAIFDFLKKEEETKKRTTTKHPVKKAEMKELAQNVSHNEAGKEVKPMVGRPYKIVKKGSFGAAGILVSPHVTEKATNLAEMNKYVFKVTKRTNKIEIKRAVESNYNVEVVGVRIINILGKKIRVGKNEGWKKGYKKAIVEIKKGQSIEILPR